MKYSHDKRTWGRLVMLFVSLFALAALSTARTHPTTVSTAVNIVNNSNREIRNIYLSHVNVDDWGGNELGNSIIAPGQSFNLDNVTCDQQQVKLIGEDQDGCFLSRVVTCGINTTWTITSETARDCGGN